MRREFGSRLMESGADQHDVRDFLGHANITRTSRYLSSTTKRLEMALENMEAGRIIRTPFAHAAESDPAAGADSHTSDVPKPLIQ
jgi:hypothetical protein